MITLGCPQFYQSGGGGLKKSESPNYQQFTKQGGRRGVREVGDFSQKILQISLEVFPNIICLTKPIQNQQYSVFIFVHAFWTIQHTYAHKLFIWSLLADILFTFIIYIWFSHRLYITFKKVALKCCYMYNYC